MNKSLWRPSFNQPTPANWLSCSEGAQAGGGVTGTSRHYFELCHNSKVKQQASTDPANHVAAKPSDKYVFNISLLF